MNETHRRTVESGYDRMTEQYLATKDPENPLALRAMEDLAWGAPMVWSHYDRNANVAMLREAGFKIKYAEPRTGDQTETWLWVLASKSSREGAT